MKAKPRKEIAHALGFSPKTLDRKLKEKNIHLPNGLVTPDWQKVIFEAYWYPDDAIKKKMEHLELPSRNSPG